MKEIRILKATDLRELCIENNWFTCGNNEEYNKILSFANSLQNVTTENIIEIANTIQKYSNTEMIIREIAFDIAYKCITYFE